MLDVRKMERPHRSGVLAIAVAYALLYIAVDFTSISNLGTGTWKDLVVCHLLPMACIDLSQKSAAPPPAREYQVTQLIYCPACKVKKHDHECTEVPWPYSNHHSGYRIVVCPDFEAYRRWPALRGDDHTLFYIIPDNKYAEWMGGGR